MPIVDVILGYVRARSVQFSWSAGRGGTRRFAGRFEVAGLGCCSCGRPVSAGEMMGRG